LLFFTRLCLVGRCLVVALAADLLGGGSGVLLLQHVLVALDLVVVKVGQEVDDE
jgi:hypothetical protein